jgi:phenylalanyl-tRNA synthetase alpha chain
MKMTEGQLRRLNELGVSSDPLTDYTSTKTRDEAFKRLENSQLKFNRKMLKSFRTSSKQPPLIRLQESLGSCLREKGFIQVTTPTIISKNSLEKMSINKDHKLSEQVFWLEENKCLRPMLAPNLYEISRNLLNIYEKPLGIFEIGSCFRKESQGNIHLNEFTMLNFVEWGTPLENRTERIKEIAGWILEQADIEDYSFKIEESVVYGSTVDIIYKDTEIASSSMGPHYLDDAWGIDDSWVGIGFGLERLLMLRDEYSSIHPASRSVSYLDGIRINIK